MSFEERLAGALREAVRRAYGVELDGVHVERPNDPSHGDFATNVALANAKGLRRNPREVAEVLVRGLDASFVRAAEVAGPGFINFRLSEEALWDEVGSLLDEGDGYGRREATGRPVLLEFVSVNPTGPMTVAHGRHAAYGDSLARIMEAAGRAVAREYYFNDGGNQIRLLAESVAARYAGLYESMWPVSDPDALYRGEYVTEKSLYESGAVEALIQEFRDAGHAYESEGAVWLATSGFGDDKDRVLVKRDGTYTYMGPDLAYHRDKWDRGFGTAVDVLGADHAGYPPRIRAGLVALGLPREFLDVELIRLVKLMRAGEQVKVSKRAGTFVTLDELLDEVGVDVARYFYVRSSHKTEMNFDLDLAIRQSDENPVFYVQYAHARIASIFERAGMSPKEVREILAEEDLAFEERLLILELSDFPRVVRNAAARREVHPLPTYLETLATRFHRFYTVHQVLVEDKDLRQRRLALCAATKNVLRIGLGLLGVEAPEKM